MKSARYKSIYKSMVIEYYARSDYGMERFYAKDTTIYELLFELTGKRTLTARIMEALKGLGFTFTQVIQ